jgi:outer membrane lipoprotein LolB
MAAAAAALLTSGLQGCTTLPSARPREDAPPRAWRGRFALEVAAATATSPADRSSGGFLLVAGRSFTEIELVSPLGNTLASARSGPDGAVLRTADGRSWQAADAGALTETVLGWRIPIDRLPDWLEGRIAVVTEREDGASARPLAGTDAGWQLRVEQWDTSSPRRLYIVFPERVKLRLIVDAH